MRALERAGGGLQDLAPRGDVARDRDHAHPCMLHQGLADAGAAPADHVEHALGQDLRGQAREQQRRERRLLAWLEHDGIAGGQRGRRLPRRHHQRVVPGRDRGDHANGVAPDHAGVAREVLAAERAVHAARGAREKAEAVGDGRDLVAERACVRLAAVQRFEPRESFRVGLDECGELEQQAGALRRRGLRPAFVGASRGLHRAADLLGRGFGHLAQHLAGGGVEDGLGRPLALDQLVVDEKLGGKAGGDVVGVPHGQSPLEIGGFNGDGCPRRRA